MNNDIILQTEYKELANKLDTIHKCQFRNHCFLRIVNDNAVGDKWDNIIKKPFFIHATKQQLQKSVDILTSMLDISKDDLMMLNKNSLVFRKKIKFKSIAQVIFPQQHLPPDGIIGY
jgi:hypothetical protein